MAKKADFTQQGQVLVPHESELPSLPQVVLEMLRACQEDADFREIGRIVGSDAALTARVLALANSTFYSRGHAVNSLERALMRLGIDTLRQLVITAALRQFLSDLGADHWQQLRDFWRHSLATALMARALAVLTRYPQPDEAFLVGMLHNIGELISIRRNMLSASGKPAADDDSPEPPQNHAEIGAILAERWGLGPLAADAIRYQQEAPEAIWDTPHLVKLLNLSTRLAMSDVRGIEAANTLFGLTAALSREISNRIDQEVLSLAESLNIPLEGDSNANHFRNQLLGQLAQQGLVDQATASLRDAGVDQPFAASLLASLELLSGGSGMVMLADEAWLSAQAISGWQSLALRIPLKPARSLLALCAETQQAQNSFDIPALAVVDQQVSRLLDRPGFICLPVMQRQTLYGVLVAGQDETPDENRMQLLRLFAKEAGRLLTDLALRSEVLDTEQRSHTIERDLLLHEMVHEISNPLTIIGTYLSNLQGKLSDQQGVSADLKVIREELDRAGDLLMQLRDTQENQEEDDAAGVAVDREIRVLSELLSGSLFAAHHVTCDLRLPKDPVYASVTRGPLRQVLINLIRNAVEAMPDGGPLLLEAVNDVWQGHRQWVEITITDSGPGLPDSVRQSLFRPVSTEKGEKHSGLGLSIVKKLIDDMEGIIGCKTGNAGTSFRILLPTPAN